MIDNSQQPNRANPDEALDIPTVAGWGLTMPQSLKVPPVRKHTVEGEFWDPAHAEGVRDCFSDSRESIEAKYAEYQADPSLPLKILLMLLLVVAGEIAVLVFYFDVIENIFKTVEIIDPFTILMVSAAMPIFYVGRVYAVQRDLVKMLIAKEYGWVYDPGRSQQHWSQMVEKFPDIFKKGTENQNMQDEFWGKFKGEKQTVDFYSGIFEYTVVRISGRQRITTTHHRTIFGLKLNKQLKTSFRLEPEGTLSRFFNYFRSKEINTESAEFNRTFAVFYNGQKAEKELEIVKTLSPTVQVKLLDLRKAEGPFSILFSDGAMIFMFNGKLLKKMHTNFFRKVELDRRDKELLARKLNQVLEISVEIVPFLD